MLLLSIFILLLWISVNYNQVTNSLYHLRISLLIFALTGVLSLNSLYIQSIGSGMGIYSGLFQVTTVTQYFDIFIAVTGAIILSIWPSNGLVEMSENTRPLQSKNYYTNFTAERLLNVISTKNYPREYSLITLISTLGAMLLISSCDLISLYICIELQSFGVYILATIYKNSRSAVSAGLKYFLLGSLSSCIILLGSSLIYTYTGLTNLDSIYSFISVTENTGVIQGISLGIVLMFIGFFFKIGAAPLHNWSPDVYSDSPTIVTIWLTIMPKISLIILLLELYINIGLIEYNNSLIVNNNIMNIIEQVNVVTFLKNLILISSLISLIIGSTVGLSQLKIKRLLAYSTISHIGYLLLALAINTEQSVESLLFYLIQYTLTNLNIFLIIIALGLIITSLYINKQPSGLLPTSLSKEWEGSENDIQYITDLKGIFYKNPLISICLSICLFSMAGIPPLIGFFSKQFVLYAAIQKGYYFISITAIIVSVISASYYLNIIKILHTIDTDTKSTVTSSTEYSNINSLHSFIISTLTISILFFIFKPSLLLNSTAILSLTLFNY
jgi:NADH-ubiquinone oxidoreductase chain 2